MKKMKIMPEIGCWPIWVFDEENRIFENVSFESVGLSEDTGHKLLSWDAIFQNTYDMNVPDDAKFNSEIEEEKFEEDGLILWQIIKSELARKYVVSYFSWKAKHLYE